MIYDVFIQNELNKIICQAAEMTVQRGKENPYFQYSSHLKLTGRIGPM